MLTRFVRRRRRNGGLNLTSVCKVSYKQFIDTAVIDEYEVEGNKQTKVTIDEHIYLINGHHRTVNLYKILRKKNCHRCGCSETKLPL